MRPESSGSTNGGKVPWLRGGLAGSILTQPLDEAINRRGKIRISLASRVCESAQLLCRGYIQIAHASECSIQVLSTDVGNHAAAPRIARQLRRVR
jgi:hypothetical protein